MARSFESRTPTANLEPAEAFFSNAAPVSQEGKSLAAWVKLCAENKALIWRALLYGFLLSTLVAFLMPDYYSGVTSFLPPQQTTSLANSTLGQLAPLMALAGKDIGLKNPSDLYVSLLQSRTVEEAIINKFDLQEIYGESKISEARKKLEKRTTVVAGKDGIIRLEVEDKDQHRAVLIAGEYTRMLYKMNQKFAVTEAAQRRIFFADEMKKAKDDLADAEVALKKTQESTGLFQLDSQAKAIISSVATLRAQIAAKEVELHSMEVFSTSSNPEYSLMQQQIAGLREQLHKAENSSVAGNGNIMVPTGSVPAVGLEYMRRYRDVQFYQAIFELLAKQYEIAKVDEAKTAPVLQLVDQPSLPDKISSPKRSWLISGGTLLVPLLMMGWIFVKSRAMDVWHSARSANF
jgi:capsule polysaccharide export protein KpsE/RkpR